MRILKYAASIAWGVVASACIYTGPTPERDPIALSPFGVQGVVNVGPNAYGGELLLITTADFTLQTSDRVIVIPFAIAGWGKFSSIDVETNGAPWAKHLQQLKYASRYPYGIPAPALAAILQTKHQAAPDTIKLSP